MASVPERVVTRVAEVLAMPGDSQALKKNIILMPGEFESSDPFLLMAEDWFNASGGFETHPHRGFETITYLLEGRVAHEDNHGGKGVLGPGDVQWMTAGRGVLHSELAHGDSTVHSLQLWLNLPAKDKMTTPRYQDLRGEAMPVRREPGATARVFSGRSGDVQGPALNHVPVTMVDFRLEAGATIRQEVPAGSNGFVYVLSGKGSIGADSTAVRAGQVAWFAPLSATPGDKASTVLTLAADSAMQAILWAGEPLREPVVARGPFVMNSLAEVQQAYADFRSGRF